MLELTDEIKLADEIYILGRITDFSQYVNSLEIDHRKIERAGAGMEMACCWKSTPDPGILYS